MFLIARILNIKPTTITSCFSPTLLAHPRILIVHTEQGNLTI